MALARFLVLAFVPAAALALNFDACRRHPGPTPLEVRAQGCTQQPCIIRQGQVMVSETDFILNAPAERLTAELALFLITSGGNDFRIPWSLPDHQVNVCQPAHILQPDCSHMQVGGRYTYHLTTEVSAPFTDVTIEQEMIIRNERNEIVFCYSNVSIVQ
ncbi:uncharacterized protein LOC129740720 [Uranotaenia lowii]|uniref:uncharacterized protein LOC129740720 n=1 Tax=Uranotaenia lowii TaxID=190385 RepID=UPI00247970C1|nr:uncharacterized protein LOC129740720 [Uranotaenia lowii]